MLEERRMSCFPGLQAGKIISGRMGHTIKDLKAKGEAPNALYKYCPTCLLQKFGDGPNENHLGLTIASQVAGIEGVLVHTRRSIHIVAEP